MTNLINKFREELILEGRAKKTIKTYISCLNVISNKLNLSSLTQEKVNKYFVEIEAPANTVNQHKKALIKLVKILKLDVRIPKFIQAENSIPEYFDEDYFLNEIVPAIGFLFDDEIRIRCLFYLMFYTGLRVGEIANLKKVDFDLVNKKINIQKRKAKNPIIVFYPKDMAELIELQFDMHPEDEKIFNCSDDSVRYYCNVLSKNLEKHITPHTFRHSFAVSYLKKGGSSKNLQTLLGHKCRVATDIYMQMTDEDREIEYRKIMKIKRRNK